MGNGWIVTIIVGIIAGFLAGKIMKGAGYGILMDLVLGLVGGLIGGFIANALGLAAGGLIWSIIIATLGAVLLPGSSNAALSLASEQREIDGVTHRAVPCVAWMQMIAGIIAGRN
jgi:uncharacterized membrane protein YeaQ/YmgE (transglycosylase-associated protein family)